MMKEWDDANGIVMLVVWIHGYEEKLLWNLLKVNSCHGLGALKVYG